jgi:hypothetical protein
MVKDWCKDFGLVVKDLGSHQGDQLVPLVVFGDTFLNLRFLVKQD